MKPMKQTTQLLMLLAIMLVGDAWGQGASGTVSTTPMVTPGGMLDAIFDKDGNQYNLNDLQIITAGSPLAGAYPNSVATESCTGGYFNLYFEINSGMTGTTTIEVDRRNLVCQLFTDISNFINSPLTSNGGRVNIFIRNPTNAGVSNPSTSGVLGSATAFYSIPISTTVSGIADNLIWQTIITGTNAYTNVIPPLFDPVGGGTGSFYHGMVTFNFENLGYNWHTDLSTATAAGTYDMYSIGLHEVTHALGFASLINQTGGSKFGNYTYYSRYDLFLKNHAGTLPLITNTGSCSMYNFGFNPLLSTTVLQTGSAYTGTCPAMDHTDCSQSITYMGGVTQAVFTPTCFSDGSSLSHFEDECHVPSSFTTTPSNNMYFVMSNANSTGPAFMKRFLKPEERIVLCDLGYSVSPTYSTPVFGGTFNYSTTACPGIPVAGINDGITGGSFNFMGLASSSIAITGLLTNDFHANTFECLEDITYGTTPLSATTGINATIITFTSSVLGIHLLRYIPVSVSGVRGNITYVYVYVNSANCIPTACQMINNGDFENLTPSNCGQFDYDSNVTLGCWNRWVGGPDLFILGCTSNTSYTVPTSAAYAVPGSDSWSGTPNNRFVGLWAGYPQQRYCDAMQTMLNTPMVNGGVYTLSFKAKLGNSPSFNTPANGFGTLLFSAGQSFQPFASGTISGLPTNLTAITSQTVFNTNTWAQYVTTFTYTGSTPLNYLQITNASLFIASPNTYMTYVFLDDVNLVPASQYVAFNPPPTICSNQNIIDLRDYLNPFVPNVTYTGAGISHVGQVYSFNPAVAGVGNWSITATITNTLSGCVNNVTNTVSVISNSFVLIATASPTLTCPSNSVTLTANGGSTYTWQPGNVTVNPYIVTPTFTTQYNVSSTNSVGCVATQSVIVNVSTNTATLNVSPTTATVCAGQSFTLSATGAATYTWQPGNLLTSSILVIPSTTSVYSVNGTDACNRMTGTKTITLSITPNYTLSISSSNTALCVGQSATLTATGAGTTATNYTWTPTTFVGNPRIVSPTINTTYTVSSKNSCGVTSTQTITITVVPTPTITAVASPTAICAGATATLTASGASSYTWMPGNSTAINYAVNPSTTTIYTLTGATAGCKVTKTVTITILSTPLTIVISPASPTICLGQSLVLTASGANSYTWSTGANTNTISVLPNGTSLYSVIGGANGCAQTSTQSVTVYVKDAPSITITNTLSTLCSPTYGSNLVTFTAVATPSAACTWTVYNANTNAVVALTNTVYAPSRVQYNLGAYQTGSVTLNFCATASATNACSSSSCITIYPCCQTTVGVTKYTDKIFTTNSSFSYPGVAFGGTITVNSGVLLSLQGKAEVYVDPNTIFIINDGGKLTLKGAYMHGCYAMWDGIYANNNSIVNIGDSRVEDAKSALNDATGGANFNIQYNYFNKNQQAIYFGAVKTATSTLSIYGNLFTCASLPTPTIALGYTPITPNLSSAPTFSSYPIATMLPPYAGKQSYLGIALYSASKAGVTNSVITIGSAGNGAENVFDKLKMGIFSFQSCAALQNNVFQNIKTSTNNSTDGFTNIACAFGLGDFNFWFGGTTPYYNSIGGSSTALKNTFLDCDNGVYSYFSTGTLVCTYNRFDKQSNGVYVTGNNLGRPVNINNNNFVGCTSGAYFFNNSPIVASVSNNNFDNSAAAVGSYSNNFAITCAEAVPAYNPSSFPNYTIYNNNIKNYYKGIMAANTLSTSISDNEVDIIQAYGNDWQYGIHVANCSTPLVKNNIIKMSALYPAYWQVGIDCKTNITPRVQCNSITNTGIGLKFDGSNTTAAGDGIIGNLMQNNGYGMWLVSNGEIGNQYKTVGTTTLSADNAWNGYTCFPSQCYYTYAQQNSNVTGGGSQLFTRSSGIYNLPNTQTGRFDAFNGFLTGTNNSSANTGTCNANTTTPSNLKLGANALAKLMQGGEDDADDYNQQGANMGQTVSNILSATDDMNNNAVSKRAIKHYQLYRNIQLQNIDSTGSSKLSGFMNSAKNQNTGLFFAVDSLLHRAERDSNFIASAKYLNNSITIKNKVDKTHQAFNNLYVNYLAQHNSLQPSEIKALENVALLCPAIYGTAVYQARAVLFHITRKSYTSDCEKVAPAPSTKKIGQFATTNSDIVVYPNPATNELYIDANGYNEVTLKLYNLLGEMVMEKPVATNQGISLVNLANGIYTYKIYNNNNELKADKLIIIK